MPTAYVKQVTAAHAPCACSTGQPQGYAIYIYYFRRHQQQHDARRRAMSAAEAASRQQDDDDDDIKLPQAAYESFRAMRISALLFAMTLTFLFTNARCRSSPASLKMRHAFLSLPWLAMPRAVTLSRQLPSGLRHGIFAGFATIRVIFAVSPYIIYARFDDDRHIHHDSIQHGATFLSGPAGPRFLGRVAGSSGPPPRATARQVMSGHCHSLYIISMFTITPPE